MASKILIVGATGTVGRNLVLELQRCGARVRAATRDPGSPRARASLPPGAEIVPFDLEQPAMFARALAGVDRVFLLARPGDEHADRVALPFIEAMEKNGVQHVVNLTAMGSELLPDFPLRKIELRLEASAAEGRMTFTHLRPNWFMQVFAGGALLDQIRATRTVRVPAADARISWIDARDVAAVAAVALTEPRHRGQAYTLTGEEALHHGDVVALVGAASGAAIRYEPIEEGEARAVLAGAGFPPPWIERLIRFYGLVRAGLGAPVSSAVRDVLGRPARAFRDFARENAGTWASL